MDWVKRGMANLLGKQGFYDQVLGSVNSYQ